MGTGGGGEVEIATWIKMAKQAVANAAADESHGMSLDGEGLQQPLAGVGSKPGGCFERGFERSVHLTEFRIFQPAWQPRNINADR